MGPPLFQERTGPKQFRWDYYDESLPYDTLHGGSVKILQGIAALRLPSHSLNFLVEWYVRDLLQADLFRLCGDCLKSLNGYRLR